MLSPSQKRKSKENVRHMAEEKTNGEEIYGGADGALERAEKSSKARREFIEKAMEPAEKAQEELVRDTATEEVRLQGTKETKAPKELRPYVEKVNVVDRRALAALIERAKAEGRRWKVSKCIREGYRYTFTSSAAAPLNEKKEEPKLDVVGTPADELTPETEPSAETGPERVLTAMDVVRGLVDISVTDDGRLSICAKPEGEPKDGEEPIRITTRPVTDEERAALGILPGDGAGVVSDAAPSADTVGEKAEPLDEASSAEKRAYRNGGEDFEDLIYGRTIGRLKNRLARDTLADMYKNGGEDHDAAKDALKEPAEEVASDFEDKEGKMQAKGYHEDDEYDMDDLKSPIEPKFSRKCPKCDKVDLNDAGECPLCDLGDESTLKDDEDESLVTEGAKKPLGGDRFVKTVNSPIDSVDYLAELEKCGVRASTADDGVMVPAEDYDFALDILMALEDATYSQEGDDRNEACFGGECKSDKPLNEDSPVPSDIEVRLDDLDSFRPVAGARETWDAIAKAGKTKELADVLSDFAKDGRMTTTDLNDMLWFERDWVLSRLGINGIKPDDEVIDAEAEEI
jgi:hypothetical protein